MSEGSPSHRVIGRSATELRRFLEKAPDVCPVCRFTAEGMRQHVDYLFYELVNDRPTRKAIREAGGFCRRHVRLIREQADALGTALIYKDVLTNELRALEGGRFDRPRGTHWVTRRMTASSLSRFFDGASTATPEHRPCPLCQTEQETEELAVDSLLEGLADPEGDPEGTRLFSRSTGLCLPHFRLAFDRCTNESLWERVLQRERQVLAGLIEDLGELARKYDYRFRDEAPGAEAGSWQRALNISSGWTDE